MEPPQEDHRLESIAAILIAVVTVIGAVIAWRASVAGDGAGDADLAGLQAVLNQQETEAVNYGNAYSEYQTYLSFKRYRDTADLLQVALEEASPEEEVYILSDLALSNEIATTNEMRVSKNFVNDDGTFNLPRRLSELRADAARERDTVPAPHFTEADDLREKSNQMLLSATILAIGVVCFTTLEAIQGRWRYLMFGMGLLFVIAGAVSALMLELQ